MLKPFAVSRREIFTLTVFLINLPTDDKEERKKRSALFREMKAEPLKKSITRTKSFEEIREEQEQMKADPMWVNPRGAYAHQWADEEFTTRVELHQSTIDYLLAKLSGKMDGGAAADVLGELYERVVSLRDTNEDRICSEGGDGYRLPRMLWTEKEIAAANASRPPEAAAEPVAG